MDQVEQAKRQAAIEAIGFVPAPSEIPKRLIASIEGLEKSGKTHFAMTAPEPIMFFSMDIGTEGVVEKFKKAGKEIYIYEIRIPKTKVKADMTPILVDIKGKVASCLAIGQGTVVFDTGTEFWEIMRLARLGKLTQVMPHQYTEVNQEFRDIIKDCYDSGMNVIFLHKLKDLYENNVRTNKKTLSGFGGMGYEMQINIRLSRENGVDGAPPTFRALIKDCRHNPNLSGAYAPVNDFTFLVNLVHATSDPERSVVQLK